MAEKRYIDRPPRIEPELPAGINVIPNPPDLEDGAGALLQQAFLPMVMIFGYVLASLFGQGRNMLMMIPMMLSVVATITLAIYTNSKERKLREAAEDAYKRRISELRRKMESEHEQQRIYYFYNYPDSDTTLRISGDIDRAPEAQEEAIRSGTRLWERRPTDHDFLHLRLGTSTRQSTVIYKISENEKTASPLMREATRLAEDSRLLYNVPVTIPLHFQADESEKKKVEQKKEQESGAKSEESQEAKGSTVRHAIGMTGSSEEKVHAYLRTLLVDYAAFHSPQDAMLYVAGTSTARRYWRWAYALPHCKEGDKTETLMFEQDERPGENEIDRMRLFWKNIRTILERRRTRLQDRESGADVKLPFMLVVVDVRTPAPGWSALNDIEGEAAISTILMDGQMLGAGIIFLTSDRSKVPSRCTAIIEVDDDPEDEEQAVFRYAETGFNTVRYVGKTRLVTTQEKAREFSRHLEPLDIRRGYGSTLAATVTLLEMLNIDSLDQLQELARENWRRSMDPRSADWLYTAVGLLSGNEPRVLTFSAKADGVHGLVAGSTGSGKSELLMTLILGMALNFNPDVLNFVLVDYKGGSAFEPFKKLPHKVDIVTNLDQSATARVFASIIAELDRRQKLNTYTNSKDIVHYRKKGLNLDPERPPYPHLFIIIDEFAEMISGNAEYKAQLESITRLGRALGVTLILAAQRPVGVTDQMRANIKFRICLRVETPDDSRELLRRADAAFLPPGIPGRGYLQIGNENIEMIQTAYAGGDYKGPQEENVVPNVIWVDRPKKTAQKTTEPPKLYDVMVDMLANLAQQESKPQWRPWPEFLPTQTGSNVLSLQTPLDTAYMNDADIDMLRDADSEQVSGYALNEMATTFWEPDYDWKGIQWGKNAMRPLIGIIDNPYLASQKPLRVDFPNGHAVVFGASGRGKTVFMRTIITALALTHSPDELHIYILDLGGRALTVLSDLPHVGAVITSEEEERVLRALRKVNDIIDHRQVLFSEARVNSLDSYNLSHPEKRLPAVLVVIDNFAEFKEYYEGLMGPLISLVRESRAYGVHFLFSADAPNALSAKLFNLITERFTLKLSDSSEYSTVVGRGVPADLSAVPGRGYVRVGNTPLEFQTALTFTPDESDPDGMGKINKMCVRMKQLWGDRFQGEKPSTVETLPLRISLENLMLTTAVPQIRRINGVMGIDDRTLEPALIDIERQGPHMIVIGQPFSGKTTTLRTLILSAASNYTPDEFMLVMIDYSRKLWKGSEHSLAELPHVVQTIDDIEQLDEFYENLKVECEDFDANPRRRKIMIVIDNYDAFTEESSRKKMTFFENMAGLIRKYQTAGVYLVVSGSIGITSASDDLRKVFTAPNFGIALKSADAVNRLNGRFPRSLADTELPMGRAFIVRSGITNMLQLATPYANDDDTEGSLDTWVRRIKTRHPVPNVTWLRQPGEGGGNGKTNLQDEPTAVINAVKAAGPDLSKYDIPDLKKKLVEFGLPEDMIGLFSDSDVVENARQMGLLSEEE
jgi:DNA segregation ATPase FtsK/SpoIIIE, S-DNA-T family